MSTKKINVLKPKYRTRKILSGIKECLDKGWTGIGFKTEEFESEWCKYTGLPHSHFISSNTAGLHLALEVFKRRYAWEEGSEVITTPLTFISSNHAILHSNLKPVFADVDESLCLSPLSILSKITPKTKAVMYVGIGGNTGELEEVERICLKHNLKLILDAAHMAGTKVNKVFHGVGSTEHHVGQEADVTVFSFQSVKNLPTADSGMICFRERENDSAVRKLSWLGINKDTFNRSEQGTYKWKYNVDELGYKYHGNSIMASIGLVQLKYLDKDNAYRRKVARWYTEILKEMEKKDWLNLVPDSPLVSSSSKHLFQIRVNEKLRDDLILTLQQNNIYPGVHYIDNTQYPMYKDAFGSCPNAHLFSNQLLTLPIHLGIKKKDVKRICNIIINKIYENCFNNRYQWNGRKPFS